MITTARRQFEVRRQRQIGEWVIFAGIILAIFLTVASVLGHLARWMGMV
jgi:hypothetical protein